MKFKTLTIVMGLAGLIVTADYAVAVQGNQNGIKPAIFPVSPTSPPPAVPTQFDVTGYMQNATIDPYVCTGSGSTIDPRL
jgi:hypothetical protein